MWIYDLRTLERNPDGFEDDNGWVVQYWWLDVTVKKRQGRSESAVEFMLRMRTHSPTAILM